MHMHIKYKVVALHGPQNKFSQNIYYTHGLGWVVGSSKLDDKMCRCQTLILLLLYGSQSDVNEIPTKFCNE